MQTTSFSLSVANFFEIKLLSLGGGSDFEQALKKFEQGWIMI